MDIKNCNLYNSYYIILSKKCSIFKLYTTITEQLHSIDRMVFHAFSSVSDRERIGIKSWKKKQKEKCTIICK